MQSIGDAPLAYKTICTKRAMKKTSNHNLSLAVDYLLCPSLLGTCFHHIAAWIQKAIQSSKNSFFPMILQMAQDRCGNVRRLMRKKYHSPLGPAETSKDHLRLPSRPLEPQ
jgi:hypothetical protein